MARTPRFRRVLAFFALALPLAAQTTDADRRRGYKLESETGATKPPEKPDQQPKAPPRPQIDRDPVFLERGQVMAELLGGANFGSNRSGLTPSVPPSVGATVSVGAWSALAITGSYSWNKIGGVGGLSATLQAFSGGPRLYIRTGQRAALFAGPDIGWRHAAAKFKSLSIGGDRFLIAPSLGVFFPVSRHFGMTPQYRLLKPIGAGITHQVLIGFAFR